MSPSVRGLASGVDINKILDELMAIERRPIARNEAQISRAETIAGLWRDLTVRFDALQRSLQPLLNQATFTTAVASSSDPERVRVAVTGPAATGSYRLEIERLATRHGVVSGPAEGGVGLIDDPAAALGLHGTFTLALSRPPEAVGELFVAGGWLQGSLATGYTAVLDGNAASVYAPAIASLQFAEGFEAGREIRLYLEGFTGSDGKEAWQELADFYGTAGLPDPGNPHAVIGWDETTATWQLLDREGAPFSITGDHPRGNLALRAEVVGEGGNILASHHFSFKIAQSFTAAGWITVKAEDSLHQIAGRINAVADLTGVTAGVIKRVEGDWRLVLESRIEGAAGQIQGQHLLPAGTGMETYGADAILECLGLTVPGAVGTFVQTFREAADACFTLNGLPLERASNSVADLIAGLTLTLCGTGEVRLEVQPDRAVPREAIERFVNTYNEANSLVRAMLEEKTGPLQGDPTLLRLERRLRSLVHGPVTTGGDMLFRSLAALGITSEKENTEGYLYLDAARLERALEESPEAVFSFFASPAGTGGLARQLDLFTTLVTGRDGVIPGRRAYLDRQIDRMRKQIEAWEERLVRREANLVRRFTFMEQYISRVQEQTGLLATFEMQWQKDQ